MAHRHSSGGGNEGRMLRLVLTITVSCVLVLQLSSFARYNSSSNRPDAPALSIQHPASSAETQMHTRLASVSPQDATAALGAPPYRLPKLIHQTVVNKSRLSCEEQHVIDSWKRLNPNHTHHLWDDEDMRQFMLQHYPELVPVPYDLFVKGTERSDLWRVLVLHKLGGVYADMDVECLQPIDKWNAQHGHDAAVLLGLENFDATRKPHRVHVTNWAMAAVPGHPLLARFPAVVVREVQKQYFALASAGRELTPKLYEQGILDRTGPAALTAAMYDYFESIGVDLNTHKSEEDFGGRKGVIAGGVRVLPGVALSSGWEVAAARSKGVRHTCADVAAAKPQALVCHMFWGSWRSTWRTFKQTFTYGNCSR